MSFINYLFPFSFLLFFYDFSFFYLFPLTKLVMST